MELLKNAKSPEFWKKVRESEVYRGHRESLFALWEEKCQKPIEVITYSDFRRFFADGNRTEYEAKYFRRRLAVSAAALLALIYPEEEKYLLRLMDEIYTVCDEYTWCLPAHQPSLEGNCNDNLDLFACETAFTLAEVYTILEKRLEPLILNRIRAEIERRIIPSYSRQIWHWEKQYENWNAVCNSSVACTFMLLYPDLFRQNQERFMNAAEYYLAGFKEDGICLEGVSYWNYGFGFFTEYADMIRTFTEGEVDYFARPHVKKIATFMQKCYLSGSSVVSFSDGGRKEKSYLSLLHYLKKEYPNDVSVPSADALIHYDHCARFGLHLRSFTWFKEDYADGEKGSAQASYFAENAEWFIRKGENYGFAAKGGHNREFHNHNDVGTFIFAKDGRQVISDVGAGTYTRQYFKNETRYGFFHCSSRGHSVPIIGEELQKVGDEYRALDFSYENGMLSMDIAPAYGLENLKSLVRSFSFDERSITLTDRYTLTDGTQPTERFITLEKTTLVSDGKIEADGVTLTYDPDVCTAIFREERVDDKTVGHETVIYLTDFVLKDGVDTFTLTMTV